MCGQGEIHVGGLCDTVLGNEAVGEMEKVVPAGVVGFDPCYGLQLLFGAVVREGRFPLSLDPTSQTAGRAAQQQEARPWGRKQQSPRAWHPLYCHIPSRPAPAEGTSLGRGQLVGGPRGLSGP